MSFPRKCIVIHQRLLIRRKVHHYHRHHHHLGAGREKTNILSNYGREIKLPSVSIIVPARNEEREICRCLTSLLGQNYPNYEIIAVDDNSSDNTLLAMQKIRAEHCQSVNRKSENESIVPHTNTSISHNQTVLLSMSTIRLSKYT